MSRALLWLILLCLSPVALATGAAVAPAKTVLEGQWQTLPDHNPVASPALADFRYRFSTELLLQAGQPLVLVFNGTHVFEQATVSLRQGDTIVFEQQTGASAPGTAAFFLRNDVRLPELDGQFQLIIDYDSLFTIVAPEHQLWYQDTYHGYFDPINTLNLLGLGILLALLVQYTVMAVVRVEPSVAYYALFVGLNILYFANATLVLPHWLNLHLFALNYLPILLSNLVYILFVFHLLKISRQHDRWAWWAGALLCGFIAVSGVYALLEPSISNEINRLNVNLFLLFGLTAAVYRSVQGSRIGLLFLLANACFVLFGLIATRGSGAFSLQVEQIGLLGITLEALLLSLLIAYKLHLGEQQKINYLEQSARAWRLAHQDPLTGLSNRLAFDADLHQQQPDTVMALLDLNKLKQYNDRFGHTEGDRYLRNLAQALNNQFADSAKIYRIGGDEFVLLCDSLGEVAIRQHLKQVIEHLRQQGFAEAGISLGTSRLQVGMTIGEWFSLADQRMYADKRSPEGLQRDTTDTRQLDLIK